MTRCQGCKSYETGVCYCVEHQLKASRKCPCIVCLVKMMCEDRCEDYQHYWDNWKDYLHT